MYLKVTETIARWQETPWVEITEEVESMQKGIDQFLGDARRLPGESKKYPAYEELKSQLDALEIVLPLVQKLAHESIKERHWEALIDLTHKDIPF